MSENEDTLRRSDLAQAKRIVVKVGSSSLTNLETGLARRENPEGHYFSCPHPQDYAR